MVFGIARKGTNDAEILYCSVVSTGLVNVQQANLCRLE